MAAEGVPGTLWEPGDGIVELRQCWWGWGSGLAREMGVLVRARPSSWGLLPPCLHWVAAILSSRPCSFQPPTTCRNSPTCCPICQTRGPGPEAAAQGCPEPGPGGLPWEGWGAVRAVVGLGQGACLSVPVHPEAVSSSPVQTELENQKAFGVHLAPGTLLLWFQAAGPVSSSAETQGRRSSALALWATSCCPTASPVKVNVTVSLAAGRQVAALWSASAST